MKIVGLQIMYVKGKETASQHNFVVREWLNNPF